MFSRFWTSYFNSILPGVFPYELRAPIGTPRFV